MDVASSSASASASASASVIHKLRSLYVPV